MYNTTIGYAVLRIGLNEVIRVSFDWIWWCESKSMFQYLFMKITYNKSPRRLYRWGRVNLHVYLNYNLFETLWKLYQSPHPKSNCNYMLFKSYTIKSPYTSIYIFKMAKNVNRRTCSSPQHLQCVRTQIAQSHSNYYPRAALGDARPTSLVNANFQLSLR